jgi:rod shape determining protein RodA
VNLRNTPTREFDFILLLSAVGLAAYGAALIYSGSLTQYGSTITALSHPMTRQVVFACLGLVAMIAMSRLDYRILGPLSLTIYLLALAALAFVLVAGSSEFGARRWINVAGTQVQPSELAKVCTVIMLAKYLSDHDEQVQTLRVFLTSLVIAAVPAALVLVEPDLGSSVVFLMLWLGMVLAAGARPLYIGTFVLGAGVLAPLALFNFARGYQQDRIDSWLHPERYATEEGFNIIQAETSIGSGRLWGKGFTDGTQTQLDFLRTQTTDYVFSVGAEELGFVGALALFALFMILLFRCLRIADHADDAFGRLIAVGVMTFILFQVFVNIGVNIRLLPVTGVPLPLVSQGGSSLVTILGALGILQSVLGHRRRRRRRI